MSGSSSNKGIYWFRKALRLHDNPSLLSLCKSCSEVRFVFILDPWFVKNARVGVNRWRFLRQSLQDIDNSLRELKTRLYVVRGNPTEEFPKLFQEWNTTHLGFEVDTEPYAKQRDAKVVSLAEDSGVHIITRVSHTLYSTERIIDQNKGNAPLTYQKLQTLLSAIGTPPKPVPRLSAEDLKDHSLPYDSNHEQHYGVPTLEELGVKPSVLEPNLFPGGESEAISRMERNLQKTSWVCQFAKPNTEPNALEPSTTVLSPYLKFGCLSARTFYYKLLDVYKKGKNHTKPPVSLHGQLLWREFFYCVGSVTPNFDKMVDNPICRQIPWDDNKDFLEAWKNARTGYPFIDAIMTQLHQEGWIHHLARHAVACFLTRGDLWISWEEGQKVFEELLLDADWSLNAGNWMWLSASAFFHQYFRVYSPIEFGKKTDKNGDFIKKYLPVLKKIPAKYIYEPWNAPLSVQQAAGCIIGKDYPKPIVDHKKAKERNLSKMKAAYDKNSASASNHQEKESRGPPKKKQKIDETKTPAKKVKNSVKSRSINEFLK